MTRYTETWGIASPDGSQQVAVPKDVSDNADTTDAALTDATTQFEATTRAALIASGAAVEMTNLHPNPGAEYGVTGLLANGATNRGVTSEWVESGTQAWKCVHTDATSYGVQAPAAFFAAGAQPLDPSGYAVGRFTVHNGTGGARRMQARLFAAIADDGGNSADNGAAVAATTGGFDLAAGETRTITLRATNIYDTVPAATRIRLQFWRLPGSVAAAGDAFYVDNILVTTDPGLLPPEGQPFDGDQALAYWTGTPGQSPSVGLAPASGSSGGGGGSSSAQVIYLTPDGKLSLADALTQAATAPTIINLAPGTYPQPNVGIPSNTALIGSGRGATIIQAPNTDDARPVLTNADHGPYEPRIERGGNFRILIRDLTIDGNKDNRPQVQSVYESEVNNSGTGISIHRGGNITIENVETRNCVRRGLFLRGWNVPKSRDVYLTNVFAHHNGELGIHVGNAQRAVFYTAVHAEENGGGMNLQSDQQQYGLGISMDHSESTLNGVYCFSNYGHGLYVRNVFANVVANVTAARNGRNGIHIVGMTDSEASSWAAMDNGWAPVDTTLAPDGWADIYFEGGNPIKPSGGYGPNNTLIITSIRGGNSTTGNWLGIAAITDERPRAAAYGIYIADNNPGNVRLVGVFAKGGTAGDFRVPASTGFVID